MPKSVYFVKYGKANSIVKSKGGILQFVFSDKDQETIVDGRIGNFWAFEEQLKEKLQGIGFQQGYFRKNTACVAIPIHTSPNDMKNVFDSFDQLGFTEVYTIFEPVALIYGLSRQSPDNLWHGIIDAGSSKVDISLINKHEMIQQSTFNLSKKRMERWFKDQNMTEFLANIISEEAQMVFGDMRHADFQVILTGGGMQHPGLRQILSRTFEASFTTIIVDNNDDFIVHGMESIWLKESGNLDSGAYIKRHGWKN